jgi:hypothetical protein
VQLALISDRFQARLAGSCRDADTAAGAGEAGDGREWMECGHEVMPVK